MKEYCKHTLSWFDEETRDYAICGKEWDKCFHNPEVKKEYAEKFKINGFESGISKSHGKEVDLRSGPLLTKR